MVHRARWVRGGRAGRHAGEYPYSANVVCNRVPDWHAFKIVEDPVTCPECIRRMERTRQVVRSNEERKAGRVAN